MNLSQLHQIISLLAKACGGWLERRRSSSPRLPRLRSCWNALHSRDQLSLRKGFTLSYDVYNVTCERCAGRTMTRIATIRSLFRVQPRLLENTQGRHSICLRRTTDIRARWSISNTNDSSPTRLLQQKWSMMMFFYLQTRRRSVQAQRKETHKQNKKTWRRCNLRLTKFVKSLNRWSGMK